MFSSWAKTYHTPLGMAMFHWYIYLYTRYTHTNQFSLFVYSADVGGVGYHSITNTYDD